MSNQELERKLAELTEEVRELRQLSAGLTKEVRELQQLLASVEPLLRALLKRAPKRYQQAAPKPSGKTPLTDEQIAEIWRRTEERTRMKSLNEKT